MQIGMIGMGKMGRNMMQRLTRDAHECFVFDKDPAALQQLNIVHGLACQSLQELVSSMARPRVVWLMVPAATVELTIQLLITLLDEDDILVDGGNSCFQDDIRRAAKLAEHGIRFVDVGTSGGIAGLAHGYCLMAGGTKATVDHLTPLLQSLSPTVANGVNTVHCGYLHCGPHGAGHFAKMVHNGIEYGIMGAYAEGLNILRHANAGKHRNQVAIDSETTPLRNPEFYQFEFNLADIAEVWRHGSIISSWLLDLTAGALRDDPAMATFTGHVSDSGEGRWTVAAALDEAVPVPIISAALFARFDSRGNALYADKVLSAMRYRLGGHIESEVASEVAHDTSAVLR